MSAVYAILPAGGSGERLGLFPPKQYQVVLGRPLVSYTLKAFENRRIPWISKIIVVVAADRMLSMDAILRRYCHTSKVIAVPGGSTRHRSIKNGLNYIQTEIEKPAVVVIHDAVRPFPTEQDLTAVVAAAATYGAGGVIRPLTSTVIAVDSDGFLTNSLDRNAYRASEMPQAFGYALICSAYNQCSDYDLEYGTECLHLASKYSAARVKLVEGGENLWKVTYRKDIYTMEGLVKEDVLKNLAFIRSARDSVWVTDIAMSVKQQLSCSLQRPCEVYCQEFIDTVQIELFHNVIFCYEQLDSEAMLRNTESCGEYFSRNGVTSGCVVHCLRANSCPLLTENPSPTLEADLDRQVEKGAVPDLVLRIDPDLTRKVEPSEARIVEPDRMHGAEQDPERSNVPLAASRAERKFSLTPDFVAVIQSLVEQLLPDENWHLCVYGVVADQRSTTLDIATLLFGAIQIRESAMNGQVFCSTVTRQ